MALSRFPFGFAGGVAIQGLPVVTAVSNQVLWVDSATGNDGNAGSVTAPCATIAGAIAQINANANGNRIGSSTRGSVIMLKPSHTETLTATTTYSLAGLSIIGVSSGEADMPKIILATNSAAGVVLGAAGMGLRNVKIVCNVAATPALRLSALGCVVDGVTIMSGTANPLTGIAVLAGVSNGADGARITNCYIDVPVSGINGILLSEPEDRVMIINNIIFGSFSNAGIYNPTATAHTCLTISGNQVGAIGNGVKAINIVSTCTGIAAANVFTNSNNTTAAVLTGLLAAGNSLT
jgi:hypothetical protein